MRVFVVRHAKAGNRAEWTKPDERRPLTKPGRKQAEGLVRVLAPERVMRVVSSPFRRCVDTVEPLAEARSLRVETDEALAEGASLERTLELLDDVGDGGVVCSHGDVIGNLVGHLASAGVPGADPSKLKKGSTWVIESSAGAYTRATYVPPPAT